MSKPKGLKYTLFPNLWEFLNLIASVLGLGTKATVWGNNKTFYESGFLPIENANGDVNAVDILKHIVQEAQRKRKLDKFHNGIWRSIWWFPHGDKGLPYEQLARNCIYDYIGWIRTYKSNMKIRSNEIWSIYEEYLRRCIAEGKETVNVDNLFCFNNPEYLNVLSEYIEWRKGQDIRKACINIICNFLGENFRIKSEAKYDELFQNTMFSPSDYQNLITKDLKNWTSQDKALAFSIPFSGFSQEEKYRLYSEVFDRIVSNPDRLARNGSRHPNKWIDQFTELGYSFGWMEDKKLDDTSKLVLRREKSEKEKFGKIELLANNSEISELFDAVKKELYSDLEKNREPLAQAILVKGSGQHFKNILSELPHQLPKDAIHQIRSGHAIGEILKALDVLSSNSYDSHLMWRATSKYYPFFGSTGYLCKQRLQTFIPRIRGFIQKHPKMVELVLIMIVSFFGAKNKFNFKKIQQEKTT